MKKLLTKGIQVPKLLDVNEEKHTIEMEYIDGLKLKDLINDPLLSEEQLKDLLS